MTKLVIFDLDDTLCKHSEAFLRAQARINIVLQEASLDIPKFWHSFNQTDAKLLKGVVSGFVCGHHYKWQRFYDVCSELSSCAGVLPDIIGQIYYEETVHKITLFEDVVDALEMLQKKGVQIAILCNGDSESQREKYRRLNLIDYVNANNFFVSEELGFAKPNTRVYEKIMFEKCLVPEDLLVIGDSIDEDICGAKTMGIRTLLLDRNEKYSMAYVGEIISSFADLNAIFGDSNDENEAISPENEDVCNLSKHWTLDNSYIVL